jgi:hypothetical protein
MGRNREADPPETHFYERDTPVLTAIIVSFRLTFRRDNLINPPIPGGESLGKPVL